MNMHVLKAIGECIAIVAALAAVVYMFERMGEMFGYFQGKKTKVLLTFGGILVAVLFNAELFLDVDIVRSLQAFDFGFVLAFVPFCFGIWRKDPKA